MALNDTRLTGKDYWDKLYESPQAAPHRAARKTVQQGGLWARMSRYMNSGRYSGYILDEVLPRRYLPTNTPAKVLEVGSAPGTRLVDYHKRFGWEPFGVEYAPHGVETNRAIFLQNGLPPENVIQADFLAPEFGAEWANYFDIVCSFGFIEHFTDVISVIQTHLRVLKPGGRLFITIPNLRGINYWAAQFFHPEIIPLHNLEIMTKRRFTSLFSSSELKPLYCDYVGVYTSRIQNTKSSSWKRHVLRWALRVELPLELAFHGLFGRSPPRGAWFSPYLVFLGEKCPTLPS